MPRVRLNAKKYARSDFQAWIRAEMKQKKLTNADMGALFGYTGQNFSQKLAHMGFSYDELVKLIAKLDCPLDRTVYFMTGERI